MDRCRALDISECVTAAFGGPIRDSLHLTTNVGVIFGRDLVYRPGVGWVGQPQESKDRIVARKNVSRDDFTDYVKSIYRVLLTRGLRGCYVHFLDPQTRDFVLSRLERPALRRAAEKETPYGS